MIHYSCDRCKHRIETDEELRYTVWIEIQVALDSSEYEYEDERQHLDELNEIMERLTESEREEVREHAYQRRRFDLCSDCHKEYIQNPLVMDQTAKLGFSDN